MQSTRRVINLGNTSREVGDTNTNTRQLTSVRDSIQPYPETEPYKLNSAPARQLTKRQEKTV